MTTAHEPNQRSHVKFPNYLGISISALGTRKIRAAIPGHPITWLRTGACLPEGAHSRPTVEMPKAIERINNLQVTSKLNTLKDRC